MKFIEKTEALCDFIEELNKNFLRIYDVQADLVLERQRLYETEGKYRVESSSVLTMCN